MLQFTYNTKDTATLARLQNYVDTFVEQYNTMVRQRADSGYVTIPYSHTEDYRMLTKKLVEVESMMIPEGLMIDTMAGQPDEVAAKVVAACTVVNF